MNENLRILIVNVEDKLSQKFVKELYQKGHNNYLCVNISIHQSKWISNYLDMWKPDIVFCVSCDVTKCFVKEIQKVGVTLICKSSNLDEFVKTSLDKFYILKIEDNANFNIKLCELIEHNKFGVHII